MKSRAIVELVSGVTKPWARQRKAEERDATRKFHRRRAMVRSTRVTLKDAAFAEMEAAYLKASSGGRLPAHARQIMYAARGAIQNRTGEALDDKYFTQTLLPEYLRTHRQETADWDVVFDARGHFREPHTGRIVPLGTLEVRRYLRARSVSTELAPTASSLLFPTHGPAHRYGAILYIEKEGFLPIFERTQLAERYDIAIMSTKGLSVTAARLLVDRLCGEFGIPLLVLHDFDKAGFSIVGTMRRNTERYTFENQFRIVDLGLRLEDVEANDLDAEDVQYKARRSAVYANLLKNGASPDEADFIADGRRVELNAFASAALVEWIEAKLAQHGIAKVVPDRATLESAFRRSVEAEYLRSRQDELLREAQNHASQVAVPRKLAAQVRDELGNQSHLPWDRIVGALAQSRTATASRSGRAP